MKPFRLARLLRLKEEQAKIKRLDWALSERDVASADDRVTQAKTQVALGEEQLRGSLVTRRASGGMQSLLGAHQVLDSQREDIDVQRARLEQARLVAGEKRLESQAAKRDVEALARLEHRWLTEQKSLARRRVARASDEYIASKVSMKQALAARQRGADGNAETDRN